MTPRDLDPEVVPARLAHLDELMRILVGMGHPQLSADTVARPATERILSQSVDMAIVAEAAAAAPRVMDDLRRAIAGWLESLR